MFLSATDSRSQPLVDAQANAPHIARHIVSAQRVWLGLGGVRGGPTSYTCFVGSGTADGNNVVLRDLPF